MKAPVMERPLRCRPALRIPFTTSLRRPLIPHVKGYWADRRLRLVSKDAIALPATESLIIGIDLVHHAPLARVGSQYRRPMQALLRSISQGRATAAAAQRIDGHRFNAEAEARQVRAPENTW